MAEDEELKKSIRDLVRYNRKLSSVWWTFLRGILYGLGFFIGSAVLAAVLIYIFTKLEGWGLIGDSIHNIFENALNTKP